MKNKVIIVAIDFSNGSLHALKYAVMMANKVEADIKMMWVEKPDTSDLFLPKSRKSDQSEIITNHFEDLVNRYKHGKLVDGKNFRGETLNGKLDFKLKQGKVYKEVVKQALKDNAYMIIAGTHGASGFEEFWLGSNAGKIVESAPCPTITLRYGTCIHEGVKNIVVPIGVSMDTRQKVPYAIDIAERFGATLHLLQLIPETDSYKITLQKYTEQVEKALKAKSITYKIASAKKQDHVAETLKYIEKVSANLLVVMTSKESENNFFAGTYAQQLLRMSSVPVLHVHPKELYSTFLK